MWTAAWHRRASRGAACRTPARVRQTRALGQRRANDSRCAMPERPTAGRDGARGRQPSARRCSRTCILACSYGFCPKPPSPRSSPAEPTVALKDVVHVVAPEALILDPVERGLLTPRDLLPTLEVDEEIVGGDVPVEVDHVASVLGARRPYSFNPHNGYPVQRLGSRRVSERLEHPVLALARTQTGRGWARPEA